LQVFLAGSWLLRNPEWKIRLKSSS